MNNLRSAKYNQYGQLILNFISSYSKLIRAYTTLDLSQMAEKDSGRVFSLGNLLHRQSLLGLAGGAPFGAPPPPSPTPSVCCCYRT